jgi:hypothetical protein
MLFLAMIAVMVAIVTRIGKRHRRYQRCRRGQSGEKLLRVHTTLLRWPNGPVFFQIIFPKKTALLLNAAL